MARDFDVVVLGAGAAGLFCAMRAGQRGRRVLLLEHADAVGKKSLLADVRAFETASRAGKYYESFNVNSKNYMDTSKGTRAFIGEATRGGAFSMRGAPVVGGAGSTLGTARGVGGAVATSMATFAKGSAAPIGSCSVALARAGWGFPPLTPTTTRPTIRSTAPAAASASFLRDLV